MTDAEMPSPRSVRNDPPITMANYLRIHSVARAVLDGADAHTTKACVFFSFAGAYLLERIHKRNAQPMAGAAFYALGGDPLNVLTYGRLEDDDVVSDIDSFHCWVECEGWLIDFMAPLFGDVFREHNPSFKVSRKMFQRRAQSMTTDSPLEKSGDFLLIPNRALTNDLLIRHIQRPSTGDLADVCRHWYRPAPKRMQPSFAMGSSDGTVAHMSLKPIELAGAW